MKIGSIEVTRIEYAVCLAICAGKQQKRMVSETKRSLGAIRLARITLCKKLGISAADTPAIVHAAAAADLLKVLPPLCAATSALPNGSKHAPWTPSCQ
jgi:hypothetical protein